MADALIDCVTDAELSKAIKDCFDILEAGLGPCAVVSEGDHAGFDPAFLELGRPDYEFLKSCVDLIDIAPKVLAEMLHERAQSGVGVLGNLLGLYFTDSKATQAAKEISKGDLSALSALPDTGIIIKLAAKKAFDKSYPHRQGAARRRKHEQEVLAAWDLWGGTKEKANTFARVKKRELGISERVICEIVNEHRLPHRITKPRKPENSYIEAVLPNVKKNGDLLKAITKSPSAFNEWAEKKPDYAETLEVMAVYAERQSTVKGGSLTGQKKKTNSQRTAEQILTWWAEYGGKDEADINGFLDFVFKKNGEKPRYGFAEKTIRSLLNTHYFSHRLKT